MNIAVIAANGRSGKAFIEAALKAGHTVRAGVYGHFGLPSPQKGLTIMSCDATNLEDISHLLHGADAVASFIGHGKSALPTVQTDAMNAAVQVMHQQGIRRIVSLTGTAVRRKGDKISLVDRLVNAGVMVWDPARIRDGRRHLELLEHSGLDWTVIRVLKLTNQPPKPYRLTSHGPTKWFTSRLEVAQAVLEVLGGNTYIAEAPIISRFRSSGS